MKKEQDSCINKKINQKEEEISMVANTAVKMDSSFFNDFLKMNKAKINSVVPKNPSISKDDEWRNEDFWDEDGKENTNK